MAANPALAESVDVSPSPWRPMSTAPRVGPILVRASWNGRRVAIVAEYLPVHGSWCLQNLFGQGAEPIHTADGWAEIPTFENLERAA